MLIKIKRKKKKKLFTFVKHQIKSLSLLILRGMKILLNVGKDQKVIQRKTALTFLIIKWEINGGVRWGER